MGVSTQKKVTAHVELIDHESDCRNYKDGITRLGCSFEIQTEPGNELSVQQSLVNDFNDLLNKKYNAEKQ